MKLIIRTNPEIVLEIDQENKIKMLPPLDIAAAHDRAEPITIHIKERPGKLTKTSVIR